MRSRDAGGITRGSDSVGAGCGGVSIGSGGRRDLREIGEIDATNRRGR